MRLVYGLGLLVLSTACSALKDGLEAERPYPPGRDEGRNFKPKTEPDQSPQMAAIHKSLVDNADYEYMELGNGMRALIVSDPTLDKCSCALSVRVGSFDDPQEAQGLAHFLEHMLFMGTERYPDEDGFDKFLCLHNGGFNAMTCGEVTEYYLDITPDAFPEAVDRLADFFKTPLLRQGSVEREVSAVNSEFMNGLNRDPWRLWRMVGKMCKGDEPMSKFNVGNYETLKRDGIWEEMKAFWMEKYSSDKMCVVVYGNRSVSELRGLLASFEDVPRRRCDEDSGAGVSSEAEGATDERWSVFDGEYTNRWVWVEPVADTKSLVVTMTMESEYELFRNNPYEYVVNMILRKDTKGFECRVKDKGLVLSVETDVYSYTRYSVASITMNLSEEGSRRPKEVLEELAKYLKGIDICADEYDELRKRSQYLFRYKEKKEPMEQARKLVEDMQFYPIENVLDHKYCFERFDADEVRRVAERMADTSGWLVFHVAKDAGEFEMCEEIYGVRYGVGDRIFGPEDVLAGEPSEKGEVARWTEGEVVRREGGVPEILQKELPHGRVSYLFDDSYGVPKVFVGCLLRTEHGSDDVASMKVLAANTMDQMFRKYGGQLYKTDVSIEVDVRHHEMEVRVECFNHMGVEVCRMFFDTLFGKQDVSRHQLIKEDIRNDLETVRSRSPYTRCIDGMRWMRVAGHRTVEQVMEGLDAVPRGFEMSRTFFPEVFVIGNAEYSDAERIFEHIASKQEAVYGCPREEAPSGRHRCDVNTGDKKNNACALGYYGGKYGSHKDAAVTHLVNHSSRALFFNQLRTNEELGYIVACRVVHLNDEQYLWFIVQSEKDVEFLEERVRRFVADLDKHFRDMSEDDFRKFKSGVVSQFRERKKNFELYSTSLWNKYMRGVVDQEYDDKVVEAVDKIPKESLCMDKVYVSRVFAH